MLTGNQAKDTLVRIKVFAFDNDDFFTRSRLNGHEKYFDTMHGVLGHCLARDDRLHDHVDAPTWRQLHMEWFFGRHCLFAKAAERFGINAHHMFDRYNAVCDPADFDHDTESAPAVMALQGRVVVCSDASEGWTRASLQRTGINVPVFARDHGGILNPLKAQGPRRFELLQGFIGDTLGLDVAPHEILFGDDSASVLRAAKDFGCVTLQGHWGYPNRPHSDEVDFNTNRVGRWLARNGFVPRTVPAPK